jgi:hypothetical protein
LNERQYIKYVTLGEIAIIVVIKNHLPRGAVGVDWLHPSMPRFGGAVTALIE